MRAGLTLAAVLFAVVGVVPAAIVLLAMAAVHVVRDPERLLDTAYVAAFCGLGYLAG